MSVWLKTTIVLLIACLCIISVEESRIRSAQAREAAAALEAANAIAERDSTRDLARENARVAQLVGDSIRVVEKRVVQIEQKNDALDRALGGERKAKVPLVAQLDSLQRLVASPVREESGGRHASFAVRQAPYTIDAEVMIPAPPDSGRIALSVALDPIPVAARIRCEKPDEHGVRPASVAVTSPPWARVRLQGLEQSPGVCLTARGNATARRLLTFSPAIGAGMIGGDGRRVAAGYFLGIAVVWSR